MLFIPDVQVDRANNAHLNAKGSMDARAVEADDDSVVDGAPLGGGSPTVKAEFVWVLAFELLKEILNFKLNIVVHLSINQSFLILINLFKSNQKLFL